jgi:hypothetical protein
VTTTGVDECNCGGFVDAKNAEVEFDIGLHPSTQVHELIDAMIPGSLQNVGKESSRPPEELDAGGNLHGTVVVLVWWHSATRHFIAGGVRSMG